MSTHIPADSTLEEAIDNLFSDYTKTHPVLLQEADPEWPSVCELPQVTAPNGQVAWQPIRRHSATNPSNTSLPAQFDHAQTDTSDLGDFAGIENALGFALHPDIKTHYSRYWSGHLKAEAPDGPVNLLYLWNPADLERLIENLIGHYVACNRNKTPFAAFFATTDETSDYFLTINNDTGQVQLEQPGYKPIRTVCGSLAEFYSLLVPAISLD